MKTLKLTFIALLAIGLNAGTVNAQDAAKGSTKTTTKKTDGTAKTGASGQHLKKDGTPDMRYKENKGTATKTTPAKAETKTTTKSGGTKTKAKTATPSTDKK